MEVPVATMTVRITATGVGRLSNNCIDLSFPRLKLVLIKIT
jgi:hypothetical protein